MSGVPTRGSCEGDPQRGIRARQADAGLDRLLAGVLTARSNMRVELSDRSSGARRQKIVRARLLESLEAYVSGLAARGLSAPPALRDELALQQNLAGRVTDTGRACRS